MHTHMQVYMLSQRWRDGHISCSPLLHWSLMLVSRSYLDHGPLELVFSIVQVPVPNTQWGQTNQNVRVWSRERFIAVPCKENGWLVPQKDPKLPKQNCRGFLKARWGRWEWQGKWSACAHFSDWLMVRVVSQGLSLSVLKLPGTWLLCVHQVVIFHLVGGFTFVQQLWKCASDTVIWLTQRGAKAEDPGKGLS